MKQKCEQCPLREKDGVGCFAIEHGQGVLCNKMKIDNKYEKFILEKSGVTTDLPGVIEQVGNFTNALTTHIKTGLATTTESEQEKRWAICQGCELYEYGRCKQCGCFLKEKIQWKSSSCPIEKWAAEPEKPPENVYVNNDIVIKKCNCGN